MPKKKTTTAKKTTKKKSLDYKDVQILFFKHGTDAIVKGIENQEIAIPVARRAVAEIQKEDPNVKELLSSVLSKYAPRGFRGREMPKVGEHRDYKAQALKADAPFLRLPLRPLGIKKGDSVRVSFEADQLVVKKVSAAASKVRAAG